MRRRTGKRKSRAKIFVESLSLRMSVQRTRNKSCFNKLQHAMLSSEKKMAKDLALFIKPSRMVSTCNVSDSSNKMDMNSSSAMLTLL